MRSRAEGRGGRGHRLRVCARKGLKHAACPASSEMLRLLPSAPGQEKRKALNTIAARLVCVCIYVYTHIFVSQRPPNSPAPGAQVSQEVRTPLHGMVGLATAMARLPERAPRGTLRAFFVTISYEPRIEYWPSSSLKGSELFAPRCLRIPSWEPMLRDHRIKFGSLVSYPEHSFYIVFAASPTNLPQHEIGNCLGCCIDLLTGGHRPWSRASRGCEVDVLSQLRIRARPRGPLLSANCRRALP